MLEQIVIAILALTLINTVSLYRIRDDLRALLKINEKWARKPQAETDLDLGKYDEVIARFLKGINDNPRHAKAHWYLGKAYYDKGMWQEAKAQMEFLARLNPSWRAEFADPYLREIERRLKASQ
jgi:tetratricopeptide (TPR) repeat protein